MMDVSEMTMTDLEIVVNGIQCAARQRCHHCDFHCAKWLPKERSAEQIAVIEDVIKRWREALMSEEKTNARKDRDRGSNPM